MKSPVPSTEVPTTRTDTLRLEGLRSDTYGEESADERSEPETSTVRLLHVEDNPADAMLMQEYIRDLLPNSTFDTAARLSEVTMERVEAADCALLDLSLPDASGLEALLALRKMSEKLPIIVLTGLDDMELGLTAVRDGADDYLLKNHVDAYTLDRAVQYAIERRGLILQVATATAEAMVATATSIAADAATSQVLRLVDEGATGDHPTATADDAPDPDALAGQIDHDSAESVLSSRQGAGTPTPREAAISVHSLQPSELLTPAEVAALMYVDPKTVTRWAISGKIAALRTPGGHRRFFRAEILALVNGLNQSDHQPGQTSDDHVPDSALRSSEEGPQRMRPEVEGGQRHGESGDTTAADGVVAAAVATAREFEADAVARAVTIAAQALVRAADEAAAEARTAR